MAENNLGHAFYDLVTVFLVSGRCHSTVNQSKMNNARQARPISAPSLSRESDRTNDMVLAGLSGTPITPL